MRQKLTAFAAALTVVLAGCLPQLTGGNPLTVSITSPTEATIVFDAGEPATNVILYLGRIDRVLTASQELVCQPVEQLGTSCTTERVEGRLTLTVRSTVNPGHVSASVWYTTTSGDNAARATP